jgi:hypothetical protein
VAVEVDPAILQPYAGSYELTADTVIQVKVEDGKLYCSGDTEHWYRMHAESEARFFAPEEDLRITFVEDADGRVTGLNLEMQGLLLPAEKVR